MIDWEDKVRELKRMAEELDRWAFRAEGRGRLELGRIADELRRFATDLDKAIKEDAGIVEEEPSQHIPQWMLKTGMTKPLNPKYVTDDPEHPDGEDHFDQFHW